MAVASHNVVLELLDIFSVVFDRLLWFRRIWAILWSFRLHVFTRARLEQPIDNSHRCRFRFTFLLCSIFFLLCCTPLDHNAFFHVRTSQDEVFGTRDATMHRSWRWCYREIRHAELTHCSDLLAGRPKLKQMFGLRWLWM